MRFKGFTIQSFYGNRVFAEIPPTPFWFHEIIKNLGVTFYVLNWEALLALKVYRHQLRQTFEELKSFDLVSELN